MDQGLANLTAKLQDERNRIQLLENENAELKLEIVRLQAMLKRTGQPSKEAFSGNIRGSGSSSS